MLLEKIIKKIIKKVTKLMMAKVSRTRKAGTVITIRKIKKGRQRTSIATIVVQITRTIRISVSTYIRN